MRSYKHILGVSSLLFAILLSYLYFDRPLAQWCKQYCVGSCHTFFATITTVGMSSPYLIGSALLYFYFLYFKKALPFSHHALFLFSSVAFAGIVTDTLKVFLGRFRPCMLFEQGLYGFDFFSYTIGNNLLPLWSHNNGICSGNGCFTLWVKMGGNNVERGDCGGTEPHYVERPLSQRRYSRGSCWDYECKNFSPLLAKEMGIRYKLNLRSK